MRVARVQAMSDGWQVIDGEGTVLVEADAVVLANARDALSLAPGQAWPLHVERGQITQLPTGSLPEIQRVITREGYVALGPDRPLVGATYEHDDEDTTPRRESDLANLARLEAILPGAGSRFSADAVSGRASLAGSCYQTGCRWWVRSAGKQVCTWRRAMPRAAWCGRDCWVRRWPIR